VGSNGYFEGLFKENRDPKPIFQEKINETNIRQSDHIGCIGEKKVKQ
jgi:hypothetical protein